jgi:hypothetical protein
MIVRMMSVVLSLFVSVAIIPHTGKPVGMTCLVDSFQLSAVYTSPVGVDAMYTDGNVLFDVHLATDISEMFRAGSLILYAVNTPAVSCMCAVTTCVLPTI